MEQEAQDPVAVTLLRLQKLEAVGRIAGGFAHDIGNLLTAIRLNLDAIAGKLHDEALETRVHDAIAGAECGMKAVQSLLAFTRLGKFSSERIDAAAAIRSAAAMMRQALGERSRLDLDLSGSSWPVEVDANQLQLALVNLALNARDAMPQGG